METRPYTLNHAGRMHQLIELGVDGIITDRPDVLIDVLEENRGQREDREQRQAA
jgi:glycerophosphoryl diester phosphodiesterase